MEYKISDELLNIKAKWIDPTTILTMRKGYKIIVGESVCFRIGNIIFGNLVISADEPITNEGTRIGIFSQKISGNYNTLCYFAPGAYRSATKNGYAYMRDNFLLVADRDDGETGKYRTIKLPFIITLENS